MQDTDVHKELDLLRQEIAHLSERLEQILAKVAGEPTPASSTKVAPKFTPRKSPEITEEALYAVSAAIAAFLGKKAKIKVVRPLGAYSTESWGLQGRVEIMGSHNTRS